MSTERGTQGDSWGLLVLVLPAELEEEILGRLAATSLGAEVQASDDGHVRLAVYFESRAEAEAAAALLGEVIAERDIGGPGCEIRIERVEDEHWVETFQAGLEPRELGRRFTVFPSGQTSECGDRIPILLQPGRAFGTGEHPTTRLCAEMLERHVAPGDRWVDLGCGTAILSMVIHHCGAAEVLGIDISGEAIEVARTVLRSNGLSDRIRVIKGSAFDAASGAWNGLVANVSGSYLTTSAATAAALLARGGLLVAAGFLTEDRVEVARALVGAGLHEIATEQLDGWAVLVMRND